jgi:hypothetical protein
VLNHVAHQYSTTCGLQVRRFPYEKYPEHVRDVRNYAFKTLVLQVSCSEV